MIAGIFCPNCGSLMPGAARFCMDCGRRIPTSPERMPIPKRVRFEVLKRDMQTCVYCGRKPPGVFLHIDHVIPVAKGGTNDLSNLVTACEHCNRGKGAVPLTDTSLQEWEASRLAEQERLLQRRNAVNARAAEILSPLSEFATLTAFSNAIELGWPFLFAPYCELIDLAEQHMDGQRVTKRPINKALAQLKRFHRDDRWLQAQRVTSNTIVVQLLLDRVCHIEQQWNRWHSRLSPERRELLTVRPDSLTFSKSIYDFGSWSRVREENRQSLNNMLNNIKWDDRSRRSAERIKETRRSTWTITNIKEVATHLDYSVDADGPKLTVDEVGASMKPLQDTVEAWSKFLRYQAAIEELKAKLTPEPR